MDRKAKANKKAGKQWLNFHLSENPTSREYKKVYNAFVSYQKAVNRGSIVGITDRRGIIVYANELFVEYSQYPLEELLGKTHRIINSDYHPPSYFHHLWNTILKGEIWRGEIRNRARDGSYYWVDTVITPIFNEEGEAEYFLAIRNLITDRKNAEFALEQVNQLLEEQNKALRKINMELDQFVYSTSHDLRAPLLGIVGLIHLCEDLYPEDSEMQKIMDKMTHAVNRLDGTLKGILDYSKNSRLDPVYELLDMRSMVMEQIEQIQMIFPAAGITFQVEVNDGVSFYSDRVRVLTILFNLLLNAVRYQRREESNQWVQVHFSSTAEEGRLSVSDNGEGIPGYMITQIFEMFVRYSTQSVGSGLGLYMCKEMVSRLEGTIELKSVPGEGSTFTVCLPNRAENG